MEQPNRLVVRAIIPSADNPDVHVLHATGHHPLETAPIDTSQEQILRNIGQRVLGNHLSLDRQVDRKNVAYPSSGVANVAHLRAKPVDRETTVLSDQYKWSDEDTAAAEPQ